MRERGRKREEEREKGEEERKRERRVEATVRGGLESEPSITEGSKPYLLVTGARHDRYRDAKARPNIVKGPEKAGT